MLLMLSRVAGTHFLMQMNGCDAATTSLTRQNRTGKCRDSVQRFWDVRWLLNRKDGLPQRLPYDPVRIIQRQVVTGVGMDA